MRRRLLLLWLVAISLIGAGCEQFIVPPGPPDLRYRDLIFATTTTTSDVTYGTAVDQQGNTITLRLDLYQPTGDTVTLRPLVVWVHGGGFSSGNKSSPEIVDQATTFARQGYVTASINYRLYPSGCSAGGVTTGCLTAILQAWEDAKSAVSFLRANAETYGVDPDRIAIAGTSAGAITAANVAFTSADDPASEVRAAVSLSGAHILTTPSPGDAPLLLLHGTADFVVPYAWAQNTVTAATNAGVRAVLTSWQGAGHVPYVQHRTEILEQTRNFLYWHLDLANASTE